MRLRISGGEVYCYHKTWTGVGMKPWTVRWEQRNTPSEYKETCHLCSQIMWVWGYQHVHSWQWQGQEESDLLKGGWWKGHNPDLSFLDSSVQCCPRGYFSIFGTHVEEMHVPGPQMRNTWSEVQQPFRWLISVLDETGPPGEEEGGSQWAKGGLQDGSLQPHVVRG